MPYNQTCGRAGAATALVSGLAAAPQAQLRIDRQGDAGMGSAESRDIGQRSGSNGSVDADSRSTTQIREDALGIFHDVRRAVELRSRMCGHYEWELLARCACCGITLDGRDARLVLDLE